MKSVTEFFSAKLNKGNDAKTALVAEGKSPEEIEQALGESFKMEGDKLKHFMNCMNIVAESEEKASRILVVSLNEGETVPPKAVQIDEHYYVPEFPKAAPAPFVKKTAEKGGGKKKGKRKDGPKSSPWGISPEEMAAKKAGSKKANEKKDA